MLETKRIGNKIAEARKRLNISQTELAQRLFISSQAVGKWERGESMPDITTFNRLAEILGVDLNYFSENFNSIATETKPDSEAIQTDDLQTGNQKNKLNWDMSSGNWVDADFSGLKNLGENFSSSNMKNCQFVGSEMSGLLLKDNYIVDCNFSNSDISSSQVQGVHLSKNKFNKSSLKDTIFSESHINCCDFTAADFTGVKIKSCDFSNNTIEHAVWNHTRFVLVAFDDVVFEGILENCAFENCGFRKVTFQNATLINAFFKNNKKLKQVQFIDCKVDKLTYAFLQTGKANLSGITLLTA